MIRRRRTAPPATPPPPQQPEVVGGGVGRCCDDCDGNERVGVAEGRGIAATAARPSAVAAAPSGCGAAVMGAAAARATRTPPPPPPPARTALVLLSVGLLVATLSFSAEAAGGRRRPRNVAFLPPSGLRQQQLHGTPSSLAFLGIRPPPAAARRAVIDSPRGGAAHLDQGEEDSDDEEDEEDTVSVEEESESEEEEEKEEEEEEDDSNPLSSVVSMEPVTVTVRTNAGNAALDQSVELTVHPGRDVASIKQSVRRMLPGKPPVSTQSLRWHGRVLDDEIVLDELLEELADDEVDDEDDDGDGNGGDRRKLVLQLDMVPPVDPKFVAPLQERMEGMSTSELLDAYAANEAAMYRNSAILLEEQRRPRDKSTDDGEEEPKDDLNDDEEQRATSHAASSTSHAVSISAQIREDAERIRRDLEEQLLTSDHSKALLREEEPVDPSRQHPNLQERQVRGQRVRQTAQGGVRTTVKRAVQRNLNVNWLDTMRHFCLFLFFGYFGGRTPTSRAILLLGAPSVFLLQARPVKLWLKQFLYALTDHPPGILLSLLPAPRQAILSLDVREAMKTVYGDYAVLYKSEELEGSEAELRDDGDDDENVDVNEVYYSDEDEGSDEEEESEDEEESESDEEDDY